MIRDISFTAIRDWSQKCCHGNDIFCTLSCSFLKDYYSNLNDVGVKFSAIFSFYDFVTSSILLFG